MKLILFDIHEFVDNFFDAGAGFFLHDGDGAGDGDGLRVDKIAGGRAGDVVNEASGGVDVHGGADNDEVVGFLAEFGGGFDVGDSFAEPDDMGTQLGTVGRFVAKVNVAVADVDDEVVVAVAAGFGQFAVEVEHVGAASLLVEVVDILGDDVDIVFLFKAHELAVAFVGFDREELAAAFVVEVEYQFRVAEVGFVGGDVFHAVLFPETVAVAEGADAAFGTDACACKYNNFFHSSYNVEFMLRG